MKFDEFHAGQSIDAGSVTIAEEQIVRFALEFDPQWFHVDPQRAAASRWNGLIASGWHTCCLAMKLVVDNVLAGSESFGSPRLTNHNLSNPVRPGDQLRLQIELVDVRKARSPPTLGLGLWTSRIRNKCDAEVLSLEATSLFELAR
jgi:acyl dehydratase